jgi:putative transposase
MPRRRRAGSAGLIFHVINRGAKRAGLFDNSADYAAFENLLAETRERMQISLLGYCLMPNHWHLILWPDRDDHLSTFMRRLTGTHALRWNAHRQLSGIGAVYQGRFKAIPVQADFHFLRMCRYVERNPLRAGLVGQAADWRWSSLWRRLHYCDRGLLSAWPIEAPPNWPKLVEEDFPASERLIRRSIVQNLPFGSADWREETARRLHMTGALRGKGRPLNDGSKKSSRPLFPTNS